MYIYIFSHPSVHLPPLILCRAMRGLDKRPVDRMADIQRQRVTNEANRPCMFLDSGRIEPREKPRRHRPFFLNSKWAGTLSLSKPDLIRCCIHHRGHLGSQPKPFMWWDGPFYSSATFALPIIMIDNASLPADNCSYLCVSVYTGCSCCFTDLWQASRCQRPNLSILCDKRWCLLKPAACDRVMTKVTRDRVLWDCRCLRVSVINIDHPAGPTPPNDRALLPPLNCSCRDARDVFWHARR